MADDVSAGRLHLDAYADTSGFARDAKAKIDAELKNVRARIRAELDTRGIIQQAREAAKIAQKATVVRLATELDTRGLAAKAREAAALASKSAKVKIGADIDQRQFATSLTAAVAALSGKYSVNVNVNAVTTEAEGELAAFRANQKRLPITLGTNVEMGNLGSVVTQFAKFPMLAGGVYLLGAAVGQLAGGLLAVVSSASQAVTTLAALPNLVGALGQGVAVLFAGFSGISDAVTELGEADAASAQQTQTAAGIRTDSARAVADAQQRLKDAYHQAADAARFAGYAVRDAEWGLARAQEAAGEAQERLNEARATARENLDELHESLLRSALTEAQASNALQKARQNLQDVMWDKSSTEQERRDAQLAVEEAKVGLAEQRDAHKDLADEVAKADAAGIKGSDEVVAAKEQVRDTNHALMLAERQLQEARHSAADTAASNARMIADAQQAIVDAQQNGAAAMAAQSQAMADQTSKFDELTPAAQRFARFWFDRVMPRFDQMRDKIQETILPPIQRGIEASMPFIDTLEGGLLGTARVVGRLTERVGNLFGSKGFNKDTASIMDSNNRVLRLFGRAAFNLIKTLSDLAVVAGPTLAEPFARWVAKVTKGWKEAAQLGRETGTLRDRFIRARESAKLLASIIGNLAGLLHDVGRAATPTGDRLLETFDKASEKWATWADSNEGQKRMRKFFRSTEKGFTEMMRLIANLGEMLALMGESGGGPLVGFLTTLNGLIDGLNAVLGTPYLGEFVGWLLTIAGMVGALGMVAGMMVKMGGAITLLARVSGLTALWNLFTASLLYTRIGLALIATQSAITAGAMAVLNAVMAINPFVAIAIGIIALVGLFILLYKKVDWFREGVQWAMRKIGEGFEWVVDKAKWLWDVLFGHSIFPDMLDAFDTIFGLIGKVIGLWWKVVSTYFKFVFLGVKTLAAVIKWLYDKAVKPYFEAIGRIIGYVWKNAIKPVWDNLVDFVKKDIPNAFRKGRDAIETIWDKLKGIASEPVEFIVNTVYNDGIRKVVNAIPGVPDLPEVSFSGFKTGGVLPGYTPGRDVHRFISPTGGGLELSGGEAIMRPEWTRQVGAKGVEMMNRAARRGGNALASLMQGGDRHAMGGVYSGLNRTLRFFLGGVMPLEGGVVTGTHALPYYNTGATWAGDLNSPYDLRNPPSLVRAYKAGTVAQANPGTTSYGNHMLVNHDGVTGLYAHLSSFIARVGQQVSAGAALGRVGDSGNADGVHLHFEQRGGSVGAGPAGLTASGSASAESSNFAQRWWDAIGTIKDNLTAIPGALADLANMEGWGGMLRESMADVGGDLIGWVNDKIPNRLLPDNPIPNPFKFDSGGDWRSGTAGVNLSGKTETVFTNENIVDITHDLAVIASRLRSSIVSTQSTQGGGSQALVENVTLVGRDEERPGMLRDLNHELRRISLGGVHVRRAG